MCHGHPHYHPCSHTSVKWLYCPEAHFDLNTGYEHPCANPIYSTAQPVTGDCPLQNCNYKTLKGSWNCCICGNGPNTQGWCMAITPKEPEYNHSTGRWETEGVCGHGCCSRCSRYASSRGASPEISFVEVRKGKHSRKSHSSSKSSGHRRGSTHDYNGNLSGIAEEGGSQAASSTGHGSRSSRRPTYDANVECSSKRSKTSSSSKKKGHRSRSEH
ncbi:hypothetical protein F5Y18DRAFT_419116 [Xylariaceae sp. FL1019]|nr:hypothetical protein F5Y18DRAFT_419116 [Xylariaceae sp. FL1019]